MKSVNTWACVVGIIGAALLVAVGYAPLSIILAFIAGVNGALALRQQQQVAAGTDLYLTTDGDAVDVTPRGCSCAAFRSLGVAGWTCKVHGNMRSSQSERRES